MIFLRSSETSIFWTTFFHESEIGPLQSLNANNRILLFIIIKEN